MGFQRIKMAGDKSDHFLMFEKLNADVVKKLHKVARQFSLGGAYKSSLTRKKDIIGNIIYILSNDASLKMVYEELEEKKEKAIIREALHHEKGGLDFLLFSTKYGFKVSLFAYKWGESQNSFPIGPIHLLISEEGYIPREMRRRLMAFVPEPKKVSICYTDSLPEKRTLVCNKGEKEIVIHETEEAACHDVMTMLHFVDNGKIKGNYSVGSEQVS